MLLAYHPDKRKDCNLTIGQITDEFVKINEAYHQLFKLMNDSGFSVFIKDKIKLITDKIKEYMDKTKQKLPILYPSELVDKTRDDIDHSAFLANINLIGLQ